MLAVALDQCDGHIHYFEWNCQMRKKGLWSAMAGAPHMWFATKIPKSECLGEAMSCCCNLMWTVQSRSFAMLCHSVLHQA